MAIAIIPKMTPVPKGADEKTRIKMYKEYVSKLHRLNPKYRKKKPATLL